MAVGPSPTDGRARSAHTHTTDAAASRVAVGETATPITRSKPTSASAVPHSSASWYTIIRLAGNSSADPTPSANVHAPVSASSARPTGASPRSMARARQRSRDAPSIATANARIIDTSVSRPSNRCVTASTGMRSNAGNGP